MLSILAGHEIVTPVRFNFVTGINHVIRSELLAKLRQKNPHLSALAVEKALDTILDEFAETLSQGHRVELRGFGSFFTKVRVAHVGRNPRTGEAVEIAPKRHMHFRASRQFLAQLNRPAT